MRIIKAIIRRFRGIPDVAKIDFDSCNVIVGRNDSGKSTILKAIDLFLNDSEATSEMQNTYSDSSMCEVELIFTTPTIPIIIDETITTTFEDEELLDENANLRIKKIWDTSKSKIKPEVFFYRKFYDEDDFIMKSEKELIPHCKKYSIETKKANGEEYNNAEKRKKLREEFTIRRMRFHYDFEKLSTTGTSRSKLIYDQLQKVFPRFEYFHADTSLSESDTSIQKYFKQLTNNILSEVGVDDIEKSVREGVGHVLGKTQRRLTPSYRKNRKLSRVLHLIGQIY